jgi:SAM-dependent methyltransferase
VEEGPEEGPVGDHLPATRRDHPDADHVPPSTRPGSIEPVELPAAIRRPPEVDAHHDRRHAERAADPVRDSLRDLLHDAGIAAREPLRRSRGPAPSGSDGTRSLAAAMRWSAGGRRRYQAGRVVGFGGGLKPTGMDHLYPTRASPTNLCYARSMSAAPRALAATILELARELRATAPPPRGLPYLGLEQTSGTGAHLLDALSTRGIFRKYELVLEMNAGLGGTARWLAARLGCEVVGTTASADEAQAGTELSRRSALAAQVRLLPARPTSLPFRDARFTHVWLIETLARFPDLRAALAEAYRTLRPGGTLAIQELVTRTNTPIEVAGIHFLPVATHADALTTAGFVDLDVRDRTNDHPERSPRVLAAREQLARRLQSTPLARMVTERESLAAALHAGKLGVAQLLAHRPP